MLNERGRARFGAVQPATVLPAGILVACWAWWAAADGGFFIRDWAPLGILLVALAFAVAAGSGRLVPDRTLPRLALLFLSGLVAWAFLSILWADSQGAGWEAAAKLLPVLAGCWTVSLLGWTARQATAFLGAWALGIALVCLVALVEAPTVGDLGGLRTVGRITTPMGYANAVGALAWMAVFPALLLSYRPGLPPLVQGLGLGAAVLLLEFGLLPQSRGALVAGVAAGVVMLAVSPDRLRLILRVAVAGGLLALASGAILDVQQAADARSGVESALRHAARTIVFTTLAAIAVGAAIGWCERWAAGRERVVTGARRTGTALVVLACVGAVVAVAAGAGSITDDLDDRWSTLTDENSAAEGRSSRFGTLDPEGRTDAWRVAVDLFEEQPVTGFGVGNYGREYTARRTIERFSLYVHNFWLRALAETGVVGTLLLLAALGCAIAGCIAVRRRLDRADAAVLAACLATATMFFGQASLDWLEEFEALALPGFAFLFLGASLRAPAEDAPPFRRRGAPALAALGIVPLLAIVAMALPHLASRWTDRAFAGFRADPEQAYADLERARSANPLDPNGWVSEGTIAMALGDEPRSIRAFRRSLDVEDTWYARMELAVLAAHEGRFPAARREIRAAARMNGVDPAVGDARRLIAGRRRINPLGFNTRVVERARSYFTRPEP
jgi:hypothetical protein